MIATREDVELLRLDAVYKPSVAAKKFAYSAALADAVAKGTFFETYALDSDERFYINEVATYFERLGEFRSLGVVDVDLAVGWSGAAITWQRIGPVLVQSREVFDTELLWTNFEALAVAQGWTPDS